MLENVVGQIDQCSSIVGKCGMFSNNHNLVKPAQISRVLPSHVQPQHVRERDPGVHPHLLGHAGGGRPALLLLLQESGESARSRSQPFPCRESRSSFLSTSLHPASRKISNATALTPKPTRPRCDEVYLKYLQFSKNLTRPRRSATTFGPLNLRDHDATAMQGATVYSCAQYDEARKLSSSLRVLGLE